MGQDACFAPESSNSVRATSNRVRQHGDDDDIESNEDGEEGRNHTDNYASYGQLVGPPSYEESVMYDSVVKAGGETEPAVDTQGPPLVISVADPQRRELPVILKINCEWSFFIFLNMLSKHQNIFHSTHHSKKQVLLVLSCEGL